MIVEVPDAGEEQRFDTRSRLDVQWLHRGDAAASEKSRSQSLLHDAVAGLSFPPGDGYAWVARFDSRDRTVWPSTEIAPANSLVRIDLSTGAETIWFYRAGAYPWLIDLDSIGRPVVLLGGSSGNEVRLIDRTGSEGQLVYSGSVPLDYLQADGDRLWFGGSRGIYLYSPDQGFRKVFAYDADPATANRIEPAGFCR